jgi:H+/Cl- antiporter ClcA
MLVITAGALLGNLLGTLIASLFPPGAIRNIFALKTSSGFEPITINLVVTKIVFGIHLTINTAGVLGILIAAVLARKLFKEQ